MQLACQTVTFVIDILIDILPKATFPAQVLAPLFVILEKLLHHFRQSTVIQLTKSDHDYGIAQIAIRTLVD